jgi:hypothetical protein
MVILLVNTVTPPFRASRDTPVFGRWAFPAFPRSSIGAPAWPPSVPGPALDVKNPVLRQNSVRRSNEGSLRLRTTFGCRDERPRWQEQPPRPPGEEGVVSYLTRRVHHTGGRHAGRVARVLLTHASCGVCADSDGRGLLAVGSTSSHGTGGPNGIRYPLHTPSRPRGGLSHGSVTPAGFNDLWETRVGGSRGDRPRSSCARHPISRWWPQRDSTSRACFRRCRSRDFVWQPESCRKLGTTRSRAGARGSVAGVVRWRKRAGGA